MHYKLALDVGGTFIKFAIIDKQGNIIEDTLSESPTNSEGSLDEIFDSFRVVIEQARTHYPFSEVGICIPGPFDYVNGVFHMTQKFISVRGMSLTDVFSKEGLTVTYLHDSTALLLGELSEGTARGYKRPCAVMLGTGFGFAMARDGKILICQDQRPSVSMWNKKFRDGIVEDTISRKAIREHYAILSGDDGSRPDVREIAAMASDGNPHAIAVFKDVGESIGQIFHRYIPKENYDFLVLAGQISKAFDLIAPYIELEVPIERATHIQDAAIRGVANYLVSGKDACTRVLTEEEALKCWN